MFFSAETMAAKDCEGIGEEKRGEKKKVGVGEAAISVPHWKGAISNVLIVEGVKCLRGQRRWMAWFGHSTLDSSHCSSVCLVNIYSNNISHLTSGFKDANLRKIRISPSRNGIHPHEFSVLSQGEIILQAETPTWFFHKVLQWQKNTRDKPDTVAPDCNLRTQKVEPEVWQFKDSLGHVVFVKLLTCRLAPNPSLCVCIQLWWACVCQVGEGSLCWALNINLIKSDDNQNLTEREGLYKTDQEGKPTRKVFVCRCGVAKDYGQESQTKNVVEEHFKCSKWTNKSFGSFENKTKQEELRRWLGWQLAGHASMKTWVRPSTPTHIIARCVPMIPALGRQSLAESAKSRVSESVYLVTLSYLASLGYMKSCLKKAKSQIATKLLSLFLVDLFLTTC